MGRHKTINDEFPGLFDGDALAQQGMQQAIDHAEEVFENWGDAALNFLKQFVKYTAVPFQTEDVRMAAINKVPEPPSRRAWGAVIVKAKREKLIRHVGYQKVDNPRAHSTPASLWMRI